MTSPRSQRADIGRGAVEGASADERPELNFYEIHSDRIVFTETDNTEGWIATDHTVTPQQ